MPYGLVFDVDGVLADTEALIARATIAMFRELYNVEMRPEDFRPYIGTGPYKYVEGPAAKYGVALRDVEEAIHQRQVHFVRLLHEGNSIAFPGVNELILAAARDSNWKLAIATSSSREKSEVSLRAAEVPFEKFDAYISGDLVRNKKPHPEIYLKAAAAIHLSPTLCIAVEDAITGVASAKAAGMKCLAVTNTFRPDELQQADLIVSSLTQVGLSQLEDLISTR
ncbi:MAG: HAD family phosphatase [Candidatus Hydrogenedentes bacterium]|nr:HAD family phosphatase [Candidatus Hydrogenedentota bacterium]